MAKPYVINDEFLGGRFDRFASYLSDGTLRITEVQDPKLDQEWELTQIILRDIEEIRRLRDFLNRLGPLEQLVEKKGEQLERASA